MMNSLGSGLPIVSHQYMLDAVNQLPLESNDEKNAFRLEVNRAFASSSTDHVDEEKQSLRSYGLFLANHLPLPPPDICGGFLNEHVLFTLNVSAQSSEDKNSSIREVCITSLRNQFASIEKTHLTKLHLTKAELREKAAQLGNMRAISEDMRPWHAIVAAQKELSTQEMLFKAEWSLYHIRRNVYRNLLQKIDTFFTLPNASIHAADLRHLRRQFNAAGYCFPELSTVTHGQFPIQSSKNTFCLEHENRQIEAPPTNHREMTVFERMKVLMKTMTTIFDVLR